MRSLLIVNLASYFLVSVLLKLEVNKRYKQKRGLVTRRHVHWSMQQSKQQRTFHGQCNTKDLIEKQPATLETSDSIEIVAEN